MRINISNVGNDSFSGPNRTVGVNAVDADINGKKLHLPAIVPNKIELQYSQTSRIEIDKSIIQYVQRIYDVSHLRHPVKRMEIMNGIRSMILRHPDSIVDFYLQYPKETTLSDNDRQIVHDIQVRAGSLILTDYETDREQDVRAFTSQILQLQRDNPQHVVCPTLDIGMQTEGLFAKKLDIIMEKGFDRFNIIYRSILDNTDKWAQLSQKIYKKRIWCNVVGVFPRWFGKTMISNVSRVFLFGVHTVSLGYPWIGTPNAKSVILNGNTMCFDLVSRGMTYEESRTESVREQRHQLILSRPHIINKTYFASYVPPRRGLVQTLTAIA